MNIHVMLYTDEFRAQVTTIDWQITTVAYSESIIYYSGGDDKFQSEDMGYGISFNHRKQPESVIQVIWFLGKF